MKFTRLHITNFLTIGDASVHLKDKGLQLIQGINDDNSAAVSNGSGKSSVVDAICWVLFGVTARGVKGDKVVNRERKKDCQVTLVLEHGANTYCVHRYRKHSTHKNSLRLESVQSGGNVDMTKGTDAETQKEVEAILGCSYEVFTAAVYAGQEQMPDLPAKTDKELKTLVEEAAGLDRIERAYEIARARFTTAKNEAHIAQTRVDGSSATLARIRGDLAAVQEAVKAWEEGRAMRVAEVQSRIDALTKNAVAEATWLRDNRATYDANAARIAEIEKQLADHGRLESDARTAEAEYNRLNMAIDRAGLAAAQRSVNECEHAILHVDAHVGKPCDACGKPGDENDKAHFLAHKQEQLTKLTRELANKKASVSAQAAAAVAAKAKAEAARAAVPDVTAVTTERSNLQTANNVYDAKKRALDKVLEDKKAAEATKALRETEVCPKAAAEELLVEQLRTENSRLAAYMEAVEAAIKRMRIAESVCKVFGPAGVRAQILDTVTPFLNAQTADYLSVLTDGHTQAVWTTLSKAASGDLKEKFSIEVTDDQGADCFEGLSGGEKKKVRIATALALQDLVASRATHPIDLWVGDEIDEALDAAGLERLMTILERKARERGTVLVISHNELRDWVDEVTVVRKSGKVSSVEGSLCV